MEEDDSSGFLPLIVFVIIGAAALYLIRRFFKGKQFTENVKAKDKVIIVTGASGGIGKQIARELNIRGGKVYLMCRDVDRANAAIRDLAVKYGCDTTRLIVIQGDLANFASVRKFVDEFNRRESKLDILVNNAGIGYYPKFEKTVDGHEVTFQTNYLGHFLLTKLLLPKLEKSDSPRIVNLSSVLHLFADNVEQETVEDKKKFSRLSQTYARSKLANVMHAVTLTKKLRADDPTTKITINACHPGTVDSEFARNTPLGIPIIKKLASPFTWFFMKTDYDGAQTPLFLALSKKVDGASGKYFAECAESKVHPLVHDQAACDTLYNYSMVACGLNK
ncbi:hypothetical protein FO519_008068 [Halicephalobus sp. NKZ332]|nr:hypothetical protein FO519_008068 [Halicephalobus sp. NKZ332]